MDSGALSSALGGTTISAGIVDAQNQLGQAIGSGEIGSDSLTHWADAYRASGGGPTLGYLGFNPFQIVATGAFHQLYWSLIVILLGVSGLVAMQRALVGRHSLGGRHPVAMLAQTYFRLMIGVLIIANTPLVYAVLMTVNRTLSQGVQAMASQSMSNLFQAGSMGTLTLAQARLEAIRGAAARRAVALYASGASREEMAQIGAWYDATAAALNAALSAASAPGQLPRLSSEAWTNPQTPDDQVTAYIGRTVVQNFGQLVADLASLPASAGPLSIAFPAGGSTSLGLLSSALAEDDAQAAQALAMPNTPSSNAAFETARQLYGKAVLTDTLRYLDTQLLGVIGASPTLAQRVKGWFSSRIEQAAAVAAGFMSELRAGVDWFARSIGVVLTRLLAYLFTAAVQAMIEIELFMLVLALPCWLLPATEAAFYGILRSLLSLSLAVPAFQLIMLFVDALMGVVLKAAIFGPLAADRIGAFQATGGAAYLVVAAIAVIGSGGEMLGLLMICYLIAYVFLAIYVALRTPRIVARFLKGAGAAGEFLSTFATGLIAGATTAMTAAAVGGGGAGLASRLLGMGGASSPAARTGGPPSFMTGGSGAPSASIAMPRPQLGRTVAGTKSVKSASPRSPLAEKAPPPTTPAGQYRPRSARLRDTASFGLRTFIDCLQADSPVDGFDIALHALDAHRKQKEKEAETRHKAKPRA